MAVTNFDSAIRRRDSYFYYYMQRGQLHEELGQDDAAIGDLEKSIEFLPTGPAYFALGNIAVSTSLPVAVTSTSSSTKTAIPRSWL